MSLNKIIFYVGIYTACSCTTSNKHSEEKADDSVSLHEIVKTAGRKSAFFYDSLLLSINRKSLAATVDSVRLSGVFSDTVDLKLFHTKNYPIKLVYSILGDGGLRDGYGEYYFDGSGKIIGNRVSEFYEVFDEYDSVMLYEKQNEKIKVNSIDRVGKLSKISIASREIASFMQFFQNLKYVNIEPSEESLPSLRTYSNVELKEAPKLSSPTVKILKTSTHLIYLGSTTSPEIVNNRSWIWYEVIAEDKVKGWIFGHPIFVKDLSDENYE